MSLPILLSIISTGSIAAGVILAILQLRHSNKQRARESALQMLHSFQTPEFLRAVNIIFDLPDGLSRKEVENRLGADMTSVLVMVGTLESLGIMVFKRDLDIRLVEDFFSGIIVLSGRKLKNYFVEIRNTSGRQTYYEWYQWLYEQVEKRERKNPPLPSYVAFQDWKE